MAVSIPRKKIGVCEKNTYILKYFKMTLGATKRGLNTENNLCKALVRERRSKRSKSYSDQTTSFKNILFDQIKAFVNHV